MVWFRFTYRVNSMSGVTWKTRRIKAINIISKKRGYRTSDTNPFFEEYIFICNSRSKSKKEYKNERSEYATTSIYNSIRNRLLV